MERMEEWKNGRMEEWKNGRTEEKEVLTPAKFNHIP